MSGTPRSSRTGGRTSSLVFWQKACRSAPGFRRHRWSPESRRRLKADFVMRPPFQFGRPMVIESRKITVVSAVALSVAMGESSSPLLMTVAVRPRTGPVPPALPAAPRARRSISRKAIGPVIALARVNSRTRLSSAGRSACSRHARFRGSSAGDRGLWFGLQPLLGPWCSSHPPSTIFRARASVHIGCPRRGNRGLALKQEAVDAG
jgi:hypothetical protein